MLLELAQLMFPPITDQRSLESQDAANTFNSFNFWRTAPDAYRSDSLPQRSSEADSSDDGVESREDMISYGSL